MAIDFQELEPCPPEPVENQARTTGMLLIQITSPHKESWGTVLVDVRKGAGSDRALRASVDGIHNRSNSITMPVFQDEPYIIRLESFNPQACPDIRVRFLPFP